MALDSRNAGRISLGYALGVAMGANGSAVMNSVKASLLVVAGFCLGACAGTPEQASHVPETNVPAPGTVVQDRAYVAAVERAALRRGIHVQWVNYPTKRVDRK